MTRPENDSRPAVDSENHFRPRLGVLISGRGSNLQSMIDAIAAGALDASIAVVISNRAEAQGLQRARDARIEAISISPSEYTNREAYDRALADLLLARRVSLVCLAGFMRLVGQPLLDAFPNRILNIHPSLLPAFPGRDAQRQALEYGVQVTGATVHLVTADLDGGPIVLQAAVPVLPDDTIDMLSARVLLQEHRIYPEAINIVLAGGWQLAGRRFLRDVVS
jgi:phosphoribosylglycinamide formyltransferase 1